MSADVLGDILERNVRALLVRSYVPALPAPHYRDQLESLFLREVEARWSPRRRAFRRRSAGLFVALAAALVALFFGWRAFVGGEPATREGFLSQGHVALGSADGSWRAASAEERARGIAFVAPRLTVATPGEASFDVRVSAGLLRLGAETEVEVERRGELEFARLVRGAAWFESGAQRSALAPGAELELCTPEPAVAAPLASSGQSTPGQREAQRAVEPESVPPPAPPARLWTGSVVSAEGGAPVGEFTIGLLAERLGNQTPPPLLRSFTGADGTFRWEDPPAGKQRVFVHAAGFALAALGEHDFSRALPELRVELTRGASVRGSVLDRLGNPVSGALVISEVDAPTDGLFLHDSELFFWLPIQARTGADGRFELAHLTPGRHILRASATGFAPSWLEPVGVPAAPAEELVLHLGPGGTVSGLVTRADGGPMAGAELVVVGMEQATRPCMSFAITRTDAEGRYAIEHLPPTTMIVVLLRADRPDVKPVEVREGEEVRADFGAPMSGLRLFGRVLDGSGQPLRQQNVGLFDRHNASWNQNWVASTTRDDGGYAFEGVAPGAYLLYLIDDMGQRLRCVDEIELVPGAGGGEVEHDIHVPRATLAVDVKAAATGAAVADATLILMRSAADGAQEFAGFGKSDVRGCFTFTDLRPGRYSLWAYPEQADLGFARGETVIVAEDGHESTALELQEGGTVDVLVHDPAGEALGGATLVFVDEQGDEHGFQRNSYTELDGRYHVSGLRPGKYSVQALVAGFQGTPVSFRFDLGRTPEVSLVLAPAPAR